MMLLLILLMVRVLFSLLLKLNSHHSHTFTSPFQKTLKQNHPALHNWYSVKNMLQPLPFKRLLNELLLETEWLEVMFIWLFVSIKRTWKCDFSVLNRKYLFWANSVQECKIVSLNWNLEPRPIRTCRIQWGCSFFIFSTGNTLFG